MFVLFTRKKTKNFDRWWFNGLIHEFFESIFDVHTKVSYINDKYLITEFYLYQFDIIDKWPQNSEVFLKRIKNKEYEKYKIFKPIIIVEHEPNDSYDRTADFITRVRNPEDSLYKFLSAELIMYIETTLYEYKLSIIKKHIKCYHNIWYSIYNYTGSEVFVKCS